MESRSITPGPYRATRLVRDGFCPAPLVPAAVLDEPRWTGGDPSCQWNEITKYFRAGMPLRKHRQHLKSYGNCFTACEAIDWLHQLLRNNSNFGPEVTRQQTIQLLRKLLKNHVIEDVKGRWGSENLDDNGQLFRFPINSPLKTVQRRHPLWGRSSNSENISKERENTVKLASFSKKTPKKHDLSVSKENIEYMKSERSDEGEQNIHCRDVSQEDVEEIWRNLILIHLQKILGLPSLEEVLDPAQINPGYIMYSMMHTSKHGVVVLQNNSDDLPHWVLSAMKCLANWPRSNDMSQPTYAGFERDVFRTVADYFLSLPEPLLTFEYYELFVNILGLLQPHLESVAIEALQLCCLLLPPPNRRKLQLLMRMIARISQNVDMPRLHDAMGTRSLMIQTFSRCVLCCAEEVDLDELLATRLVSFLMDHHQEILQVPVYLANAVQDHIEYLKKVQIKYPGAELSATLPVYSFCKQISPQEFEEQKVSTSQAAIVELLESIIKDTTLSVKDKKRKLKQFQKEYPDIYQSRFPTTESEAKLFGDKPTIKQPMLILRKPKFRSLRY
ncbi:DEP domain-containing protein 1A-like isoform X3 [Rhinatrema bivittatum]|uniref:DEP domain-containing protein 1A-like isoform X3 n=1 Tax=Rhinatrema bivittatum TaxID=194408 RepID=UPI00112DBF4D|nr:DEP domain-containing protein 1A-like isoform X3 [Rhinatrema bivittatum]